MFCQSRQTKTMHHSSLNIPENKVIQWLIQIFSSACSAVFSAQQINPVKCNTRNHITLKPTFAPPSTRQIKPKIEEQMIRHRVLRL